LWLAVYGSWLAVYGLWFMVSGSWFMVCYGMTAEKIIVPLQIPFKP
jgi:hypothetical protein